MTGAFGLGLGAAVLLGLGFVLQQRVARMLPHSHALSPRLFGDLIGHPLWVLGVLAMIGGQLLGAAALSVGDISLVEPLLSTNLLFALALARVMSAQPLGLWEWGGASALVGGVVLFLICAHPRSPRDGFETPPGAGGSWHSAASLLAAGVLTAVLVLLARRRLGGARAGLLGAGAGLLFGVQDGLTRAVTNTLASGADRLWSSWTSYAVVAVALVGLLLMQSAFEAAPLRTSLPVITAVEPLVGIGYGLGVFGERVRLAPGWMAGEVGGLLVMVIGIVLVASGSALAPLHHHHHHHHYRGGGGG